LGLIAEMAPLALTTTTSALFLVWLQFAACAAAIALAGLARCFLAHIGSTCSRSIASTG